MNKRRYTVRRVHHQTVTLSVHTDCALGAAGDVMTFWVPNGGGYVRRVTDSEPGTLGQQVGHCLSRWGDMLYSSPDGLARTIRHEARAALRREESVGVW